MSNIPFRIRYQAGENTPHGTLFKYLRSKETVFSLHQMVVTSLSAFWYPLACQWTGKYGEDRLQAIARLSINGLRQQIHYLACTFGLEKEVVEMGVSYGTEQIPDGMSSAAPMQATPAAVGVNGFSGNEEIPESSPGTPKLLHGNPEDDALLNQMFK